MPTPHNAKRHWQLIVNSYKEYLDIQCHLYALYEHTNGYSDEKQIPFSRESFLENYDWSYPKTDPEKVLRMIDFEAGYIDDSETIDRFWTDEESFYSWEFSEDDPSIGTVEYPLMSGGPNLTLIFHHNLISNGSKWFPDFELEKITLEFYHWSPAEEIDLTDDETAIECYQKIEEELEPMFRDAHEAFEKYWDPIALQQFHLSENSQSSKID